MAAPYAGYDVLAKWNSLSFDAATRRVLDRRLAAPPPPRFFTAAEFAVLEAAIARLLPQPERRRPVPVAAWIDARLADEAGEGYRDERLPPLPDCWRLGLAGIDAEAKRRHAAAFAELPAAAQDGVLRRVQAGEASDPEAWRGLDPHRFFRDVLLRTAAALHYAHPDAWSEIGFGGPASPRGYVRLGFDERDPWEAKEVR